MANLRREAIRGSAVGPAFVAVQRASVLRFMRGAVCLFQTCLSAKA